MKVNVSFQILSSVLLLSFLWVVQVRDKGVWLTSHKDAEKSRKAAVVLSMFPSGRSFADSIDHTLGKGCQNGQAAKPEDDTEQLEGATEPTAGLEEEISNLPLERCMRIVPHDQNGGAFFIAVLCKIAPFPGTCIACHNDLISIIDCMSYMSILIYPAIFANSQCAETYK